MYRADRSIAHAFDLKIDGTRDNKNGNVRIWDATDGDSNIYMKYMIAPNQP